MPNYPLKNKPIPKTTTDSKTTVHTSRLRAFGAFIFGLLFLFFTSVSIIANWTERTLTNTENFSQALGPLANEEAVKVFVSREITKAVMEKTNQAELANGLLGLPSGTIVTPQISTQVEKKVSSSVNKILESEAFEDLWQNGTRQVHSQLIRVLEADDGAAIATINVRPQIQSLINMVQSSELKLGEEIKLEADTGQIKLTSEKLASARKAYQQFTKLDTIALVLALLFAGLAVFTSNHRMKTLRKLTVALAAGCGLSALVIFIVSRVSLSPADPVQSDFIQSILSNGLSGLYRLNLYVLAFAILATGIASLAIHFGWSKRLKK